MRNRCKVEGCKRPCVSHGYCRNHWRQHKYWSDKEFREKEKKKARVKMREYYHKRKAVDKDWNADRQKKYRTKNPEKFNYIMCRYYFRKLSKGVRKMLVEEVGI